MREHRPKRLLHRQLCFAISREEQFCPRTASRRAFDAQFECSDQFCCILKLHSTALLAMHRSLQLLATLGSAAALRRSTVTMGGAGDVKKWFADSGRGDAKPSGGSLGGSGWAQTGKWVTEDALESVSTGPSEHAPLYAAFASGL